MLLVIRRLSVWVGNFDGQPMRNVSGVSGAGPLFRDIMLLLDKREKKTISNFTIPEGLIEVYICPQSEMLVSSSCPGKIKEIFIEGTEPKEVCNPCSDVGSFTLSLSKSALFCLSALLAHPQST